MAAAKVISADILPMRPSTSQMTFSERATSRGTPSTPGSHRKLPSPMSSSVGSAKPDLSSIEIESLLRQRVTKRFRELKQAFQNYDRDESLAVTKGELKRVLELYCLPLSTSQLECVLAKVSSNPNGTINYLDFLEKYFDKSSMKEADRYLSASHRFSHTGSPREIALESLEKLIKERLRDNMKNVLKALKLFDYNRDGKIQKHELRKIIENYCVRMTDTQFDKLWTRYDFTRTGVMDYKDFLKKLGINVDHTVSNVLPSKSPDRPRTTDSVPAQKINTDQQIRAMTMDQLEKEFRKKIRSQFNNLRKAFLAFDPYKDGTITVENLKNVLTRFTLPMPDDIFYRFMGRFGVKASGSVPWVNFLEKFQDPIAEGNGQTIPIKPAHKYNPVRGDVSDSLHTFEIINLLYKHVKQAYGSIKEAFLAFDGDRDGKITRKELRRIIESFCFRLSEDQFKELCIALDPTHLNFIDYWNFLALFEVTESVEEGHKWLNSEHRFNSSQPPIVLAWSTVEEILREKITEQWRAIGEDLAASDPEASGYISKQGLYNILNRHCLPISNDHYTQMCKQCESDNEISIRYSELLLNLGVEIFPGDVHGLSTQITQGSEDAEFRRQYDLKARMTEQHQVGKERSCQIRLPELIEALKDKMTQKSYKIRDNFKRFDRDRDGRVSKKEFREVLESVGLIMDDESFRVFVNRMKFPVKGLSYMEFLSKFEDPRKAGPGAEIQRAGNHHVNVIMGDSANMQMDDVMGKFKTKLRENFGDLRGAFYKMDTNHDGFVSRDDFRVIFDSFMFFMSDGQFDKCMDDLGLRPSSRVSYRGFLDLFQERESEHPWLNSDHKCFDTNDPAEMGAEQVNEILKSKAGGRWHDLARAFRAFDKDSKGYIRKREFQKLLWTFNLPMSTAEFELLWSRYDPQVKGKVSFQEFQRVLGIVFAPGDNQGTSYRIVEGSDEALEIHQQNQVTKHNNITWKQMQAANVLTASEVLEQLRDRFRDYFSDFQTAFRQADHNKDGYISVDELQTILSSYQYLLDHETLYELLQKLGLSTADERLNYEQFLKAIDAGRKEKFVKLPQANIPSQEHVQFQYLSASKALDKLRVLVTEDYKNLHAALAAFDGKNTSRIKVQDFRRVLDNFCFKLSDLQFRGLLAKLHVFQDLTINYYDFLEKFVATNDEIRRDWMDDIHRAGQVRTPNLLPMEEVEGRLRECVAARFYKFAQAFSEIDYGKIGVVTPQDFKDVLNKLAFRVSDEQFDCLYANLSVNEFGNVDYRDFLKQFSTLREATPSSPSPCSRSPTPHRRERPRTASPAKMSRGNTATPNLLSRSKTAGMLLTRGRSQTPMVNAENAERMLKEKVYKHWQTIQNKCRDKDTDNTGFVDLRDFQNIMEEFSVYLPRDEYTRLMSKYDVNESGKFSYRDFIRHFVINLRPQDDGLLVRRKIPSSTKLRKMGPYSGDMVDAMLRVRERVVQDWKKMRRSFRNIDGTNTGAVSISDFRHVLRQYNVNLSEDELFHLLTYYDNGLTGRVNYNDFLRAFLK